MNLSDLLHPGALRQQTFIVQQHHVASHVGSGTLQVLATPWMVAFMETTARLLLDELLPNTHTSVGISLNVRHLAPTPIGGQVTVRAEVFHIEGGHVTFNLRAWDEVEQVGEGQHERVVIDVERFLRRVQAKEKDN